MAGYTGGTKSKIYIGFNCKHKKSAIEGGGWGGGPTMKDIRYFPFFLMGSLKLYRDVSRVRKGKNFTDSKIFVTKTFRIKPVNCIIFQIRDKYV